MVFLLCAFALVPLHLSCRFVLCLCLHRGAESEMDELEWRIKIGIVLIVMSAVACAGHARRAARLR